MCALTGVAPFVVVLVVVVGVYNLLNWFLGWRFFPLRLSVPVPWPFPGPFSSQSALPTLLSNLFVRLGPKGPAMGIRCTLLHNIRAINFGNERVSKKNWVRFEK